MLQLTRWRIINQWKKRQRQQDRYFIAGSAANASLDESDGTPTLERIPDPAGLDLEAIWEDEWEKHLLHVAMERVKRQVAPEQLQVFDLYCVEQWPAHKVARTLGVSVGQVYLAKHRVGRLLKEGN